MSSIDAGSINSSVRIKLSELTGDVRKVEVIYDDLDKNIRSKLKKTEEGIKGVARVQAQAGLTQEEAIKKVITLRKEQIKIIQDSAIKRGSATKSEVSQIQSLQTEVKKLEQTQDGYNDSLEEGTEASNNQTSSLNRQAAQLAIVAVAVVQAKKAIDVYATTEQSLANVQAVTNATASEFAELEKAALDAGESTRFTAAQAADALFFLSSAGLDATQSTQALGTTLELAGATGSDLAATARSLTATMSQYGIEAEDASRISNVFAAANSNSQATMEKLTGALRQVGPVAAGLNVDLEETVGVLQLLFNAGFQGENAGRALKSALADLSNESSPTIKKLKELGIAFEDVNPQTVGLTNAIGVLSDAGIDAGQAITIFGKESGAQLATLISQGKDEIIKYTQAVTDTDEAARQYGVQNDTLAGSLDRVKSAGQNTAILFIKELAPSLRILLDGFTGFLKLLSLIPQSLKGFISGAGGAAIVIGTLTKALTLLGVTISTGPLAIIGGLAAVTVGLVAIGKEQDKRKVERLANDFGDLAEEISTTDQALDEFLKQASDIESVLTDFSRFGFGDLADSDETFKSISNTIGKLAQDFGITKEQVVDIGLASSTVSKEYKSQLTIIKDQIEETKLLGGIIDIQISKDQNIKRLKIEQLEADKAKKKLEEEAVGRLTQIQKEVKALNELNQGGAIDEIELIEAKRALRLEEIDLLKVQAVTSGEVTDQVLKDIAEQASIVEKYDARLEELEGAKKKAAEEEKKVAKELIDLGNRKISVQESINAKYNSLTLDRIQLLELEKDKAISEAEELGLDTKKILESFEIEKTKIIEDQNEKRDIADKKTADQEIKRRKEVFKTWQDYSTQVLSFVSGIASELAAQATIQAEKDIEEINRVLEAKIEADGLARETILESQAVIREALDLEQEKQLSDLDARTEETLRSLGLLEETKLESLDSQLQEAIEKGDLELQAELQKEIDRTKILEEAEAERQIIKENQAIADQKLLDENVKALERAEAEKVRLEEEAQRAISKAKYEADLANWNAKRLATIASGASAVVSSFANGGGFPYGLIPAGLMAGVTAAQLVTLEQAKPVQRFQTGGIVLRDPGTSTTGDQQVIRANPKEMVLTETQQASLFAFLNGKGSAIGAGGGNYNFYLDGQIMTDVVVEYINNGKSELN
jgi:TP901 family phage tail tape measure protein